VLHQQGKSQESESAQRRSLAVWEKMATDFPQQASQYRVHHAGALFDLGHLIWQTPSRRVDAETTWRKSLAIFSTLAEEAPDNRQAGYGMAACFSRLGDVQNVARWEKDTVGADRRKNAEMNYRQALAVLEKLFLGIPDDAGSRNMLALAQRDLALFLSDAKRFPEAEGLLKKALATVENLAAKPRSGPNLRQEVPDLHEHLGVLYARDHRPQEATEAMRRSMEGYDKLIADFPDSPDVRYSVARQQNGYAWILATNPAPLHGDRLHAVELARHATQLLPENEAFCSTLGIALYSTGDWQGAVAMLDKSVLLRKGGGSPVPRPPGIGPRPGADEFFLAMAHWQVGDKEEAHKWYRQAVEWMDKNQPEDEKLLRFRVEAQKLIAASDSSSDASPNGASQ
jgi:tetratricopeptide (TPR) repeat protein